MNQKLVFEVIIDEELTGLDLLREELKEALEEFIGCNVVGSRMQSDDEVCEDGEIE